MVRDLNGDGSFGEDEVYSYAKDHLGSIHALVDNTGKVIQRYGYSAYGKTKVEKTTSAVKLIKNPFCFTGRELDEETGDYYLRARYYSSWTGRFLSLDPKGFNGGDFNKYRYVSNDPVNFKDPNGESKASAYVGPSFDFVTTWTDSDQGAIAGGVVGLGVIATTGNIPAAAIASIVTSNVVNQIYGTNSLDPSSTFKHIKVLDSSEVPRSTPDFKKMKKPKRPGVCEASP